jgi:hypothetical protein
MRPLDIDVKWSLQRAFGPLVSSATALEKNSERPLRIARQLGLLPRVFARQPCEQLRAELETQQQFQIRHVRLVAARGLALQRCYAIGTVAACNSGPVRN